jgi:hypothetical protein
MITIAASPTPLVVVVIGKATPTARRYLSRALSICAKFGIYLKHDINFEGQPTVHI